MKIAISAVQPTLDSDIDSMFGRCAFFVLVDSETMEWEGLENPAAMTFNAGIGAVRFIADRGAKVVITGNVGPQAAQAMNAEGIEVLSVAGGSVREAVEAIRTGMLREGRRSYPASRAGQCRGGGQGQVPGKPQGPGMGRGMGRGGGGMGRGMGAGKKGR